ncbi:MAG: hypothetical protein Q4B60_05320 [Erysipelotrichaceae bacterium]|nr:hypothetical protein [Erysipelotrichaceae bacterium]
MNRFNNLKTKLMVGSAGILTMMNPYRVYAEEGDLDSAINTFSPVLNKLKAPLSMLLNLTAFGFAIFCAVRGVIQLIQSLNEDNPNEAKTKKTAAIKAFVATGISIVAVVLINAILAVFGVGFNFAS